VDLLSREPLLFEALVGRSEDLFSPGIGWTFLKSSNLQRHRLYNEFKSVLRFVLGESSARQLTGELSSLADEIVADAFTRARTELEHARGLSVALIALGKFGGGEISIGSDLDVILLHKGASGTNASKIVNTLGRRLREMLDQIYQVDFRLRPEGKNAPLASEFQYYKDYFAGRASLWERQSLLKARFVSGDADFGREVMDHVMSTAYGSPLPKEWKKEILSMRGRMVKERSRQNVGEDLKVGVGGLVDLEFLVQAVQLRYGGEFKWLICSSTFEAVASLLGKKVLRQSDVRKIGNNLEYMRRLEACIRMNSETADFVLPVDRERLQAVVAAMGSASPGAFRRGLQQTRKVNRRLFAATVRSIPK
jgi:glutamate-ammonia-ligase adenylyltransferase